MNALSRMIESVRPGGLILDLQMVRPNPRIDLDGRLVAELDGEPFFCWADAATAAVGARIREGQLIEEAVDDHDIRAYYISGAELIEDFVDSKLRIPEQFVPTVAAITERLTVQESCRLRRLRRAGKSA